jgi:hypothetical protein
MKTSYLINHKRVTWSDESAPFNNYILIDTNDTELDAYELSSDAPLCIESLLTEVYWDDFEVEVYDHDFTSTNACIKLDGDAPADCKCWCSNDFGFKD